MSEKRKIIKILTDHRDELNEMGIESISIFGSVAREDNIKGSDVDLLVMFNKEIGLFEFSRIKRRLSSLIGYQVDLVTINALRKEYKEEILKEAVDAT